MRSILCFGDSNTWGYNPDGGTRFPRNVRWTGLLQQTLGAEYYVIEAGLNGRTTVFEDPHMENRNGKRMLTVCLETHKPIDSVILALGTNDCKSKFNAAPFDIARGMSLLVEMTLAFGVKDVLVVSPAPLTTLSNYAEQFIHGVEKSQALAGKYAALAKDYGVSFLDAGQHAQASELDGLHLDATGHAGLADAFSRRYLELTWPRA